MSAPIVGPVGPFPSVTSADINEHTIQALVELVYCQTANDVLTSAMGNLQQALATTQTSLETLAGLQRLKNSLQPVAKSSFSNIFDYQNESNYASSYNDKASSFYGEPIDPAFYIDGNLITSAGSPGFSDFLDELRQYKKELSAQITFLSSITPPLSSGPDPNTLLAKLRIVYSDIDLDNFGTVKDWVMDKYDVHGAQGVSQAGVIEQHLTSAISSGQSLNTSQQQKVQNYLFIFQQYYQSAAAVLNAINQIISRMAQAVAR